jgi:glycosyltransferase involved in cell wall biosynthesis
MNEVQPLVSILINNYNYALYLTEAIESALNQTYPNTEVIVVDDGSTDKSRELIASYQNRIISIYKENGGQASAFNAGFAVSRGEIVCLLDSDDVWLPQKVEKVVEAFCSYPGAAVVYHKVQNIDKAGIQNGKPWPPYEPIRGNISSQVAKTGGWWPYPPSTALSFSREYMCQVMNVPEGEYQIGADSYLADLAPFWGEVVGIDRVLSHYRIHGSHYGWSNRDKIQENIKTNRELQYYKLRINVLNDALKRLGLDLEISLADNWPYQLLQYKLGKEKTLISLSLVAIRNPWEHRLVSKLKTIALLWLKRHNISRI